MSKVKRFSLEERYGYQNRKVIYDKNTDNDIELNNIYPIIDLFNQLDEQIADLEAKLAEKEKEIISLECVISEIQNDIKELHEFKVGEDEYDLTDSDARFSLECELLNKDQDKISFCIEQLEVARRMIDRLGYNENKCLNKKDCIEDCLEEIDNQINGLKGEK